MQSRGGGGDEARFGGNIMHYLLVLLFYVDATPSSDGAGIDSKQLYFVPLTFFASFVIANPRPIVFATGAAAQPHEIYTAVPHVAGNALRVVR